MITTSTAVTEYFGDDDGFRLVRDKDGFTLSSGAWSGIPRVYTGAKLAWFANVAAALCWALGAFADDEPGYLDASDVIELVERTWLGEGPEFDEAIAADEVSAQMATEDWL